MKRPLLLAALFFIIGIIIGYYLNLSIISLILICIIIISFSLFYKPKKINVLICILIILIGLLWLTFQETKYQSKFSITMWNDQGPREIVGEVIEDLSSLQGTKIYLKPRLVEQRKVKYGLIQLDKKYLSVELNNGDLIKAKISLKTPVKQLNPGGFSNYKYLKKKGVYSQGYIYGKIEKKGRINNLLKEFIIQVKKKFINLLDFSIKKPLNEVLKALLLGERDNLPEEWEEDFSRAGVNHLLAISGLHVGFIAFIFLTFFGITGLPLFYKNFLVSLLIILYIIITGVRPSVLRAGILSIAFLWAPFFKREGDILNLLGLTALINLVINPYELFTVGFQLTYIVLIMITIWTKILAKHCKLFFAVSIVAQLGSLPITAYYFNMITPIGIMTNIWAIPLVGLIVSLTLIGLILGLLNPIFIYLTSKLTSYLLILLDKGIKLMVMIPYSYLEVPSFSIINLIFIFILLIMLPFLLKERVIPINIKKRRLIIYNITIICLLIIFIEIIFVFYSENELEIIFFAVGQGDGILLNLPGDKHILIDGGGIAGLDSNQGDQTILPYLKKEGIKRIDIVFITHFDTDHAFGVCSLLEKRRVDLLVLPFNYDHNYLSKQIITIAKKRNIPMKVTQEGEFFKVGNLVLQVLNPPKNDRSISRNDNSIVLKLKYGNFSMLLTGDLENDGEERLISKYNLQSNILKLGHHGSNSSSSNNFLKSVSPNEGIISVGKNNYGHPSSSVIQRLNCLGIRSWRTDNHGAIFVNTDGTSYTVRSFCQNKK